MDKDGTKDFEYLDAKLADLPTAFSCLYNQTSYQPLVVILIDGLIARYGTDVLSLLNQTLTANHNYIKNYTQLQGFINTAEARLKDLNATNNLLIRKQEVIESRNTEIKELCENLTEYLNSSDANGAGVCMDVMRLKTEDIKKDLEEYSQILDEQAKYKKISEEATSNAKSCTRTIDECAYVVKNINSQLVKKDLTHLKKFANQTKEEFKQVVQAGINNLGQLLFNKYGKRFKVEQTVALLEPALIFCAGYIDNILKSIENMKMCFNNNDAKELELSLKLAKRYERVLNSYAEYANDTQTLSMFYDMIFYKLNKIQKHSFDLFTNFLKYSITPNKYPDFNAGAVAYDMDEITKKDKDSFLLAVFLCVVELRTATLSVNANRIQMLEQLEDDDLIQNLINEAFKKQNA